LSSRLYTFAAALFALALFGLQTTGSSAQTTPAGAGDDEKALRQIVKQLEDGWNAHDGKAFAAPFASDADYVVVNGMHIKGREEIERGHAGIFASIYKESRNVSAVKSVRFLRPDVAVVHVEWTLEPRPGAEKMRAINTMVMTKDGGKWSIAAFHNTPVQPPRQ
jgi:uncharacterized protein (TIGR02246 family)